MSDRYFEGPKLIVIKKPRRGLSEFPKKLKTVIETICKSMVDHPDDLRVVIDQGEKTTVVKIFPHPEDIGEILGKKGRNIAALRLLVECIGARHGIRAVIESVDESSLKLEAAA